jgi:hypothetical protein
MSRRDHKTVRGFLGDSARERPDFLRAGPRPSRRGQRHRCSRCGRLGHDVRTCPEGARLNGGVEWREPPAPRKGPRPQDEDVPRVLRAKPGQWAMIRKCPTARNARDYAQRCRVRWGAEFEVVARDVEVFARART